MPTIAPVTNDQKTQLRSRGHWSELFAAFLVPQVVYSARLSAVPSSSDMVAEISFTSGSGTLGDVRAGMTLYIGSSAGAFDLGMVRIRKVPIAGTFYIGEQSKVQWEADAYLTVVEDFDLWAKHIHMDGTTPKMDYDLSYSDQHEDFNPVPVLGANRVARLTGSTVEVTLGPETGVNSWVIDSTISGYSWTVPGAVSLSSSTAQRPVATFDSVGWHACYCTVTAANGKTKTGIRWVYIWDDDNPPARAFELRDLSEDYESGGVSGALVLADDVDLSEVRERSLCILFRRDFIDNDEVSIGQVEHCENIVFVGRVGDEEFEWEPDAGTVSIELQGYQYWFSKIPAFPVGVEIAKNTPSAWTSMPALTVDRGLWHLLEWRSTATQIMDFFPSGDTRYSPEVAAFAGTLWAQMEEFIYSQILGHVHIDALGRLYAEIDPQMVPEADRSTDITTVMDLEKQDFQEGMRLDKQIVSEVSMIDASGISIDQYGGSPQSYFALSPGHIFGEYGSIEIVDRLLLASQAECNQVAGLLYGWKSSKYKILNGKLTSHNFMVSCFPNQYVTFDVESTDTPRGETIQRNFIPRRRTMGFSGEDGTWEIELDLEAESFQENAVAYVPPSGDDISIPPLEPLPSIPIGYPTYPGDLSGDDGPPVVVMLEDNYGMMYTTNFSADNPTWQFWNNGIPSDEVSRIRNFKQAPSGSYWLVTNTATKFNYKLYWAASLGGFWQEIIGDTWWEENYPDRSGVVSIRGFGANPNKAEEIAIVAGWSDWGPFTGEINFWLGNRNGFVKGVAISSDGTLGDISYGAGKWIHVNEEYKFSAAWGNKLWRISEDGSTIEITKNLPSAGAVVPNLRRAATSPLFYIYGWDFQRSLDNGDNIDTPTATGLFESAPVACDLTGQYMMGVWDIGSRGRSTDYGDTWAGIPNLSPGGAYYFAYAGGGGYGSRWIAARGNIFYSDDFGESWVEKNGNIIYLIPLTKTIVKVIVPGYY